jgi:hypothetical protein
MARPIEDLPKIFRRVKVSVERQFNNGVQETAMAGGRTMVGTTRVDTGKARSNYIATLDNPNTGEIAPYSPGKFLGFNEGANRNAAMAQHRRIARRYSVRKNRSIFIANNLRYIGFLDEGFISRAGNIIPPGMMLALGVQSAILRAKRIRLIEGKSGLKKVKNLREGDVTSVIGTISAPQTGFGNFSRGIN